jgi:hypothetical protein
MSVGFEGVGSECVMAAATVPSMVEGWTAVAVLRRDSGGAKEAAGCAMGARL